MEGTIRKDTLLAVLSRHLPESIEINNDSIQIEPLPSGLTIRFLKFKGQNMYKHLTYEEVYSTNIGKSNTSIEQC